MGTIDRYDEAWLTSRGCPLDLPPEPTLFELSPTDFVPQVLVGPSDSVLWLWLWIKSLRRQKIETINVQLPWATVFFKKDLSEFKTEYPQLYLIPGVGEYELHQFLNPLIAKKLAAEHELDGCLVAVSIDEVPWNFAHGIEVKALLRFQLSDGRKSSHEIEVMVNRKWRSEIARAQEPHSVPASISLPRADHDEIIGPDAGMVLGDKW
jgi:hypothetical protein